MESTPFTSDEAAEIAEDFEDLKDTEFRLDGPVIYLVENVVVSPFQEGDKYVFIQHYLATKDGAASLSKYSGNEFDVLLFVYDADNEADLVHTNIRTFATQQGIAYDFPVHS
jgi:hypothetical protein